MMGREAAVLEMEEMMEEEELRTLVTGAEYASSSCCLALGRWAMSSTCFVLLLLFVSLSSSSNAFIIFSCRTRSRAGNRVVKTEMRGFDQNSTVLSKFIESGTDKPWSHISNNKKSKANAMVKLIAVPKMDFSNSSVLQFLQLCRTCVSAQIMVTNQTCRLARLR